jgi:hypothetical protein
LYPIILDSREEERHYQLQYLKLIFCCPDVENDSCNERSKKDVACGVFQNVLQ